jgi:hypothetical protein
MGNPHYTPPRREQAVSLASVQSETIAFLRRRRVEPQSHRRVLRPIEDVRP